VAACFGGASVALTFLNDRRVAWTVMALAVIAALAFARWVATPPSARRASISLRAVEERVPRLRSGRVQK
jgi:hypothetical protein